MSSETWPREPCGSGATWCARAAPSDASAPATRDHPDLRRRAPRRSDTRRTRRRAAPPRRARPDGAQRRSPRAARRRRRASARRSASATPRGHERAGDRRSAASSRAYALKPMPAYSATIMFIGFETTSGATPGARNTANANASVTSARAGIEPPRQRDDERRQQQHRRVVVEQRRRHHARPRTRARTRAPPTCAARSASMRAASRSNAPTSCDDAGHEHDATRATSSGRHCTRIDADQIADGDEPQRDEHDDAEERGRSRRHAQRDGRSRGRVSASVTVIASVE